MYVFPDCEIEIKIPKRLHGYFSFLLPNKFLKSEKTLLSYFSRELSYIFLLSFLKENYKNFALSELNCTEKIKSIII